MIKNILHGFIFKKITNILIIGFENNQECELHLSKKTEPL